MPRLGAGVEQATSADYRGRSAQQWRWRHFFQLADDATGRTKPNMPTHRLYVLLAEADT